MGRVQLSCTVFRLQNSRFFSFKGGKRRKHGFARAKREREPHTPAGRVKARKNCFVFFQRLSPVPLSIFYTRSRPFDRRLRVPLQQTNAKIRLFCSLHSVNIHKTSINKLVSGFFNILIGYQDIRVQ